MKKSQVSLEFIVLSATMMVIITLFLTMFQIKAINERRNILDKEVNSLLVFIKNEIRMAEEADPGYTRTFSLPQLIAGFDYVISLDEQHDEIALTVKGSEYVIHSPIHLTGSIDKGKNILKKTDIITITPLS